MTAPAPAVELVGVSKAFQERQVLAGFDLEVHPGELVAVTGPSLAGKTTLIELLAGWSGPDAGTIRWGGSTTPPPWSQVGVVPQGFALLEELTVQENIDLARRFDRTNHQTDNDAHRDRLLDHLGLDRLRDRGAFEVSVGERQRIMVARALADRPTVVLADEPVAHQDEHHATRVLELLRAAVDDGAAGVIASRSPELIADFCDRLVAPWNGSVDPTV